MSFLIALQLFPAARIPRTFARTGVLHISPALWFSKGDERIVVSSILFKLRVNYRGCGGVSGGSWVGVRRVMPQALTLLNLRAAPRFLAITYFHLIFDVFATLDNKDINFFKWRCKIRVYKNKNSNYSQSWRSSWCGDRPVVPKLSIYSSLIATTQPQRRHKVSSLTN